MTRCFSRAIPFMAIHAPVSYRGIFEFSAADLCGCGIIHTCRSIDDQNDIRRQVIYAWYS